MYDFRWNEWNVAHIARHGIAPEDAEYVVNRAARPYPKYHPDGKWLVIGQTEHGWHVQVVFVLDEDEAVYVIHSRPLTDAEKRRYRKRKR